MYYKIKRINNKYIIRVKKEKETLMKLELDSLNECFNVIKITMEN